MNLFVRVIVVSIALFIAGGGVALAGDSESTISLAEAQNPCAMKNPCAVGNKVDPKLITRPTGTKRFAGERADLLKVGEELWSSARLSTNGLSCQTCHRGNAGFNTTFAQPYPHMVVMPKDRAGLKAIQADEMVQFCLVVPLAAKPLPWNSKELAALTAYVLEIQKTFKPAANPCAIRNPCASNPCAPKR